MHKQPGFHTWQHHLSHSYLITPSLLWTCVTRQPHAHTHTYANKMHKQEHTSDANMFSQQEAKRWNNASSHSDSHTLSSFLTSWSVNIHTPLWLWQHHTSFITHLHTQTQIMTCVGVCVFVQTACTFLEPLTRALRVTMATMGFTMETTVTPSFTRLPLPPPPPRLPTALPHLVVPSQLPLPAPLEPVGYQMRARCTLHHFEESLSLFFTSCFFLFCRAQLLVLFFFIFIRHFFSLCNGVILYTYVTKSSVTLKMSLHLMQTDYIICSSFFKSLFPRVN